MGLPHTQACVKRETESVHCAGGKQRREGLPHTQACVKRERVYTVQGGSRGGYKRRDKEKEGEQENQTVVQSELSLSLYIVRSPSDPPPDLTSQVLFVWSPVPTAQSARPASSLPHSVPVVAEFKASSSLSRDV